MSLEESLVDLNAERPFKIEQRGIDYVPESARWATPRGIAGMWAGSAINVEYFIYGALLMGFGFSFATALSIIVIGNLSFLLLGVASLQGPETGTTAFNINRAAFGTRGSRLLSFFNWITMLGFETEGLILIVGAGVVICQLAGTSVGTPLKVVFIVVATALQAVMPYFGHATMVKVLRLLILPFTFIFVVLTFFMGAHAHPSSLPVLVHGWEPYSAGLAFTIALSGLGWAECGNDYSRYLPRDSKKLSIVGWIFLATALPEIIVMVLGALSFSFLGTATTWNSANPFESLYHQPGLPSWFVLIFLLFAIAQLFGVNSLDLYSSGVSLQSMGLRLKRYQAVCLDSVLACLLTIWATLGSTFSLFMKDFVGVIIVWIAPWFGVYITDWLLRRRRYHAAELQRTDQSNIYWSSAGFGWSALFAFGAGLLLATTAYSKAPPPVNFPLHWMTPLSNHFGSFYCNGSAAANCGAPGWFGGADFSVFLGIFSASLIYYVIESITGRVRRQPAQ